MLGEEGILSSISLDVAVGDYDHTRDLASGKVRADGLKLTFLEMPFEEIVFRFLKYREWDVSEMSMGAYCSLRSQNDDSLMAIPVFTSRMFRHSSIYVRSDSKLRGPGELGGKRVGIPEWDQTAVIYGRAILMHVHGVGLQEIEWQQAGVNAPGRKESTASNIPAGVRYRSRPDRTLAQLLESGEVDAIMTARPPANFQNKSGAIKRLIPDLVSVEAEYYAKTGIYPIMHTVVIRRDILASHPWIGRSLFTAFEEAKDRSVKRALDATISRYPVPGLPAFVQRWQDQSEGDIWPYGVQSNLTTLKAFLGFAFEQGVLHRELTVEELFAPSTLQRYDP